MPPDQRPSYPRTPAYGEGYPSGGAGPRPGSPAPVRGAPTGPPVEPRGVWLALALSVAVNLLTLLGVLVLGWPAGNVFLLFWCENVVLGLITLVRIGTAEVDPARRVRTALFFCVHYGIFCVGAPGLHPRRRLAPRLRTSASSPSGLPVVLVVVRYAVELVRTWFGPEGLRARTTPRQAMFAPYPRVVVLQVGVLVAFLLLVASFFAGLPDSPVASYGRVVGALPDWLGRPAVLAVVVLLLVKTVVDLLTTRRALRAR